MKKNIFLLLLLLILGGTIWWLSTQQKSETTSSSNERFTQFAVEEIDELGKIFIADRSGRQVLLTRKGDKWYYQDPQKKNYGPFLANQDAMNNLFETLQKVRVRMPVNKNATENVVKSMAGRSNKVELYNTDGDKIKTYYVGGASQGSEGTYYMMEGANQPYVVFIPNFVGTLDTRFVTLETHWRDRALFRVAKDELKRVRIEYTDADTDHFSFEITKHGTDDYSVRSLDGNAESQNQPPLNMSNVETFWDDFDYVSSERLILDTDFRDSIVQTRAFCKVTYETASEGEKQFTLYPIFNPNRDRGDGRPSFRAGIGRFFADAGAHEFLLVQERSVKKILWAYPYFFQQEKVQIQH